MIFQRRSHSRYLLTVLIVVLGLSASFHPDTSGQTPAVVRLVPDRNAGDPGTPISVAARLDLPAGEMLQSFEMFITYKYAVLHGTSIDLSGSLVPSDRREEITNCVDGQGKNCGISDENGVMHIAAGVFGDPVLGPLTGALLFTLKFNVQGVGATTIDLDRVQLLNPGGSPPTNIHPIIHVDYDAVFSNSGIGALFNVATAIPVAGVTVDFDASSTFNPDGAAINTYTWDFNDASPAETYTVAQASHGFMEKGNYNVTLTVTDSNGATASVTKRVAVADPVGQLQISFKDKAGRDYLMEVNASLSINDVSVANKTKSALQRVLLFTDLQPGTYNLTLTSATDRLTKEEAVFAGWTTFDTFYLGPEVPTNGGNGGLDPLLVIGPTLVGATALGGVLLWKSRRKPGRPRGRRKVRP